ncbi:lipolytic protein g-d-s-l family [Colletotrichum truncatum]|uniref:Lipolytic protein g-d-s-l family n=1 Tax=Colletotrichum truncatum TaxID=5467 RepID=A0ACC3Z7D3_COLTU|nr:lipolytic protein g-d-s-l family [Colletotrichum truncatum]KAF6785333.1 lipolytic protein g-d-s-l family [Colletotrichum truncatum]
MTCIHFLIIVFVAACYASAISPNSQAGSNSFSSIVVFGDSMSDNGNGSARVSRGTWPSKRYYNGRFSNGIVWPEYVAGNLSIPLYDYAVGGATTSNSLVQGYTGPKSTIAVPSVLDQIVMFLSKTTPQGANFSTSDSKALATPLFVLFAGANDILFNASISASQSFQFLERAELELRDAYPNAGVLTISPPDLARLPYGFFIDNLSKRQLTTYTNFLGDLLAGPGRMAANVDLRPLFDEFEYYATPVKYGFAPLGKYGSCLVGVYGETSNVTVCRDAERQVYWDEYHPTTLTHSWIAKRVLDVLSGPF